MNQVIQSEFPEIEECIRANERLVEQKNKDARKRFYNAQELPISRSRAMIAKSFLIFSSNI